VDDWDYGYTTSVDSGVLSGLGRRLTFQSSVDPSLFAAQAWEEALIDGSSQTDSTDNQGAFDFEPPYSRLALGLLRGIDSPDRQYLACAYDSGDQLTGIARYFGSGDNALTYWEVITPQRQLTTTDTPDLIPAQLHKYLKFFVLSKGFGRPGQGYRPDLASHWGNLYGLGVALLASLATPSLLDRVYARDEVSQARSRVAPRVRFPSTFEREF
jgi:hypothetical protein